MNPEFESIRVQLQNMHNAIDRPGLFTARLCAWLNAVRSWRGVSLMEPHLREAERALEDLRRRLATSGKQRDAAAAREIEEQRGMSRYCRVPVEDDSEDADDYRGFVN